MTEVRPIPNYLIPSLSRPSHALALRFKRHRAWVDLTWGDYFKNIEAAALGLKKLNVNKGDRIAVLSNTRYEWAVADFAILSLGALTVPIYQSHRPEEIETILNHSTAKILIIENENQFKKWEQVAKRCKSVEQVIIIDPLRESRENEIAWDEMLNEGVSHFANPTETFKALLKQVTLEDPATIIYTSGTQGEPKGALLTHRQILSEVEDLVKAYPISPLDSTLSFLPYSHVLGRVEIWLHAYLGFTLNVAESIERLRTNLRETRPSVLIGVPRIFEKIRGHLLGEIENKEWKKSIFGFLQTGDSWPKRALSDVLIYSRLRELLGGELRFVVCGGAPLNHEIGEFFYKAGILILEGYGLTETTAAITVNTPSGYQFGSVGRPLPEVKIRLAEDGEIEVNSQKTFKEYYLDEEATQNAFTEDGWFKTGDIGSIDARGYLRITDRKKDLIKTDGGKFVAPQKLEGLVKLNPLISQVLIHGDRKKYIVALLTLNEELVTNLAREQKWVYPDYKALTQTAELRERIKAWILEVNTRLASFETIKNFAILSQDFSVESGELTPSLKVKRRVCDEKYRATIDSLYER